MLVLQSLGRMGLTWCVAPAARGPVTWSARQGLYEKQGPETAMLVQTKAPINAGLCLFVCLFCLFHEGGGLVFFRNILIVHSHCYQVLITCGTLDRDLYVILISPTP